MMPIGNTADFDERFFRCALGRFATGVTIVTTLDASGAPVGLTANSFCSVSLAPPLILWSLNIGARSLSVFRAAKRFNVNVLASHQSKLSDLFGRPAADPSRDARFEQVQYVSGPTGVPLIEGCCAWFECVSKSHYYEGDHIIFVARVERCGLGDEQPLAFHGGKYCYPKSLEAFTMEDGV
ncbi:flavin reductase family protein [Candidimonas nitroreducens]|nr:flavin reductase family protein [Candidimonas nitroreducens]